MPNTEHLSCRRTHSPDPGNCTGVPPGGAPAEPNTLIRRCLFEQLEDRRLLAAVPTIIIDDVQQLEGDSGTSDFVFTVTRSGLTKDSSTISYATTPASATEGVDYLSTNGTLVFASRETSKTITVPVKGDDSSEGDEIFYVDLTILDNGQFGDGRGIGTIVNDDTGPSLPHLTIGDVQLVEGDSGSQLFAFTITRSGELSQNRQWTTKPPTGRQPRATTII